MNQEKWLEFVRERVITGERPPAELLDPTLPVLYQTEDGDLMWDARQAEENFIGIQVGAWRTRFNLS